MIYTYKCSCGKRTEAKRSIADRENAPVCECGQPTRMVITGGQGFTPIYGSHGFPGYQCPVTDQWVDSKRKRREIMAEHSLVERG